LIDQSLQLFLQHFCSVSFITTVNKVSVHVTNLPTMVCHLVVVVGLMHR